MNWITPIWSIVAGVCLALAGVHFLVWLRSRGSRASLVFSIAAMAASVFAIQETVLIKASDPAEYGEMFRWMHVSLAIVVIAVVWFIRLYLRAGRIWLAWLISGLRVVVLVVNFATSPNATFREITSLRFEPWLGEVFSIPVGEPNPWRILIHVSGVLLLIFVLDAGVTAWKRGDRRRAVTLCGATAGATLLAMVFSQLMVWHVMPGPFIGLAFVLIVLAIAFELSIDLIRARQTAMDLRRSEERMRHAARAAKLGLWEWDVVRDRIWGSQTDLAPAGLSGVNGLTLERYIESLHAEDREPLRRAIRRSLEDGEPLDIEYRIVDPGGGVRCFSAQGEVDRGPDGKARHVRGVTVDITDQKRVNMELQRQRDQLAHVQRVSALGQLSWAIAHEISQPLGAILRNAEAGELLLRKTPPDIEESRTIFTDIQRDNVRAVAVIDRMRSHLKGREVARETLPVNVLLEQVAVFLSAEFRAREARLVLQAPCELPAVRGDRIQLQQVLLNLLLNSLEALGELQPERREIDVRVAAMAGMIEFAVIDRGAGIAPDQLSTVFEPFMSTKRAGTGMGLAICKAIVEGHGGRIRAERNPEGGTIIRFELPVAGEVGAT